MADDEKLMTAWLEATDEGEEDAELVDLWLYVSEDGQVRFPEHDPSPFMDEPFVQSEDILADADAPDLRAFAESVHMDIGFRRFKLCHYLCDAEIKEWMGNSEERGRFFINYVKAKERRQSSSA